MVYERKETKLQKNK